MFEFLLAEKSLGERMKEVVLPDDVDFLFGLKVSPSFYSALIVTGFLLLVALIIRIFVIPRFKKVPGKFQALLEKLVEFFSGIADSNCARPNAYIGPFVFSAGLFIFFGTIIEMVGFHAVMLDLNACIAMGLCAFVSILVVAIKTNKMSGLLNALKDFSLPISMSFRLFGAILSGGLVLELVYSFSALSYGVPVIVYVLFTLLHAIIQTYVYVMLTSIFFGENTEPKVKKPKKSKKSADNKVSA
ncbi:MAG: F0F1 ATP synthase subunit A [Clostridia bacterium]|nr:F0F1 ATP synthase subunit A [Clostridia bacterium]